jgi:hypothetical protein
VIADTFSPLVVRGQLRSWRVRSREPQEQATGRTSARSPARLTSRQTKVGLKPEPVAVASRWGLRGRDALRGEVAQPGLEFGDEAGDDREGADAGVGLALADDQTLAAGGEVDVLEHE